MESGHRPEPHASGLADEVVAREDDPHVVCHAEEYHAEEGHVEGGHVEEGHVEEDHAEEGVHGAAVCGEEAYDGVVSGILEENGEVFANAVGVGGGAYGSRSHFWEAHKYGYYAFLFRDGMDF